MARFNPDQYTDQRDAETEDPQAIRKRIAELYGKRAEQYGADSQSRSDAFRAQLADRQRFRDNDYMQAKKLQEDQMAEDNKSWGNEAAAGMAAGSSFGPWGALVGAGLGIAQGTSKAIPQYQKEGYSTGEAVLSTFGFWDPKKSEVTFQRSLPDFEKPETAANLGAVGSAMQSWRSNQPAETEMQSDTASEEWVNGGAAPMETNTSSSYSDIMNQAAAYPAKEQQMSEREEHLKALRKDPALRALNLKK